MPKVSVYKKGTVFQIPCLSYPLLFLIMLFLHSLSYLPHNILHISILHPRPGRQTKPAIEESLAGAVDIARVVLVNWLQVHRLPERAGLDVLRVEPLAEFLVVEAGLLLVDKDGAEPVVRVEAFVGIRLQLDAVHANDRINIEIQYSQN